MIKGINNQPYIDIEPYLDMESFDQLQPEIYAGFATARESAKEGTWMTPGFTFEDMSYQPTWKPVYQAMEEFRALPDNDPVKVAGLKLMPTDFKNFRQRNTFTRYLKMALGAYDPYIYYFLWEDGNWDDRPGERQLTEESRHFPNVVDWVLRQIGRAHV